jgi:hypothetical protein
MKLSTFSLGLVTLLLLTTAPMAVAALKTGPQAGQASLTNLAIQEDHDHEAESPPPRARDRVTGYPIVNADTWMTEEEVPWSQLALIRGENQADYLAVPDRSYETGPGADIRHPGIASLWSRHSLEVYGYGLHQVCWMGFICNTRHPIFPVTAASLKVGDQVFHLQGHLNQFKVPEEVAWALKTANVSDTNGIWLRIAIANGSNYTTRPLGPDTVRTLATLYQDVEPPGVGALPEAIVGPVSRLPSQLPVGLTEIDESAWRRQSGVVWSEPVIVRDDFEGDYLAVLDRAYSENSWSGWNSGIITNWSANRLAIHLYEQQGASYNCWAVSQLVLQIGKQTFYLKGENNLFIINDELAKVLASQPRETPLLSYAQPDEQVVTREIGPETVAAWQIIYSLAMAGD